MIKHIVTFKLTGTPAERKEVANKFKDALMALPLTIDVLKSIEVGINENPSESWDIVTYCGRRKNGRCRNLRKTPGPCSRCRTPRRT